jgi:hypothetical protein
MIKMIVMSGDLILLGFFLPNLRTELISMDQ